MIHLEEYLDTLEALPMELQRQFTLMRELDALSQDIQDQMKQTTSEFISNPPSKNDPRHLEYMRNFVQLFSMVLKHGEEKVALATQTYDLVDKHIRKLDDDLAKFEERQLVPRAIPHAWGPAKVQSVEEEDNKRREESTRKKRQSPAPAASSSGKVGTPGKRTNSGRNNASSSGNAGAPSQAAASARGNGGANSAEATSRSRGSTKALPSDFAEMPIDPNEPRYCYCRQVSYGEMVACDDENCEIEWFHLGCVDLKAPPKGQWFCKDCLQKHKKHRSHHS
ncbi:inhibitor of growth proteins N-terminal histone-binding-domain-containing protein [Coemansia spiralis]|nr:inhibitor of growth proteins N-terminal histone-binding-domain-containing protein [Coemansia spiralis]